MCNDTLLFLILQSYHPCSHDLDSRHYLDFYWALYETQGCPGGKSHCETRIIMWRHLLLPCMKIMSVVLKNNIFRNLLYPFISIEHLYEENWRLEAFYWNSLFFESSLRECCLNTYSSYTYMSNGRSPRQRFGAIVLCVYSYISYRCFPRDSFRTIVHYNTRTYPVSFNSTVLGHVPTCWPYACWTLIY